MTVEQDRAVIFELGAAGDWSQVERLYPRGTFAFVPTLMIHLPSPDREGSMHSPSAPRVLVVDDEPAVRAFVDRVLRGAGYTVAVAPNGLEALRLVDQHPPFDGFVLDVRMPEMRGDELAHRLRQRDPTAKVLFLTGYSGELLVKRNSASLNREDAILEKPTTVQDLLEAVSRLVNGGIGLA